MTPLGKSATKLADTEERLLAAGTELTGPEQIRQARRHALWAGAWLRLAMGSATQDTHEPMSDAARHLRCAKSAIDEAIRQ